MTSLRLHSSLQKILVLAPLLIFSHSLCISHWSSPRVTKVRRIKSNFLAEKAEIPCPQLFSLFSQSQSLFIWKFSPLYSAKRIVFVFEPEVSRATERDNLCERTKAGWEVDEGEGSGIQLWEEEKKKQESFFLSAQMSEHYSLTNHEQTFKFFCHRKMRNHHHHIHSIDWSREKRGSWQRGN